MDNLRIKVEAMTTSPPTPPVHLGKQEKSTMWFIRITSPWELLRPKVNEMKSMIDISGMVIAYHTGSKTEKEHIHIALVMMKSLQKQSIAERVKKLYGVKGNEMLSIKPWNGDLKVLAYMRQNDCEIDYFKFDLTPQQEEYIQSTNTIYLDIVTEAKKKAHTRIPERIIEEMAGSQWKPKAIIRRILIGVKNGEWYPPGHQMERYVQEIMIKTDPDAVDLLTDYYYQKLSEQYI